VARPTVYVMQFYRREPGDVGIPDLPVGEMQDPEGTVTRALLSYFNNQMISPAQRPHHARVITDDGFKTILTILATGPTTVERVPDAYRP
jgi:hypothetical protein